MAAVRYTAVAIAPLIAPVAAQAQSLQQALDQDFDAYVATIDAGALRAMPQADALYLLGQAEALAPLDADYVAEILAAYDFSGTADDLTFFALVATTASVDLEEGYCAHMATKMPSGDMVADCLVPMAVAFAKQYDTRIPATAYTPAILDALYQLTADDALVIDGTISDVSTDRALRMIALRGADAEATPTEAAALANGALCTPPAADIGALALLRGVCTLDPITPEMLTDAAAYRVAGPVMALCVNANSTRRCFDDLAGFHTIAGRCREPIHFAPAADWYQSKLFATCMAGFIPQ